MAPIEIFFFYNNNNNNRVRLVSFKMRYMETQHRGHTSGTEHRTQRPAPLDVDLLPADKHEAGSLKADRELALKEMSRLTERDGGERAITDVG